MNIYTLKIVSIIREAEDAHTICFKQPALKKIKYLPGQYITIIITINNRKYKRPYSLSSAPGIDQTLNITVKRLLNGIVSNHLIDVIKVGDLLEVIEPLGDFVYKNDVHHDKEIFLWSAGSGITPLMSILKVFLQTSSKKITLFYCNKSIQQTIFHNQLIYFSKQHKDRFVLVFFYTEEKVDDAKYGRIQIDDVVAALNKVDDVKNTIHYICGPIGLKETVKSQILKFRLSEFEIYTEDFEHIVHGNELEEIQTQFVDIIIGKEIYKIEVIRGKSILEACLDYQIDLPYSCQTGNCTLCKAKLLSGEIKKIGNQKPDQEINDDERLLCCSYPLADNVVFEI